MIVAAKQKNKTKKPPKFIRDVVDYRALNGGSLVPGPTSPVCAKCELNLFGGRNPFMLPSGEKERPLVTIITENISKGEDQTGQVGSGGVNGLLMKLIRDTTKETGVSVDQVRLVPVTRCAAISQKANFAQKAKWCRYHLVEDLQNHRPNLIIGVGSSVLGAMVHKSNAQEWSGKMLTWRGWPDDILCKQEWLQGHPVFGKYPTYEDRIPLLAMQSPRIVYATQNPRVIKKWRDSFINGLKLAVSGVEAKKYDLPWWKISIDPAEIIKILESIPDDTPVYYDTETTGLEPFRKGSKIVFHMFRWTDTNGNPRALGFPWDYEGSPLLPFIEVLTAVILATLYRIWIIGHNITFDILFNCGTMVGADLNRIAARIGGDTLHKMYTIKQDNASRGLDLVAYDWAPEMAGYEEEMTLLIDTYPELLDPAEGAGGHYAKCPPDKWDTHLKPYVMGDVEVVAIGSPKMDARLAESKTYMIPLAHPEVRGRFMHFSPPKRDWVYKTLMLPAQRTLTAMMARGMFVDVNEVASQEDLMPKAILAAKSKLRNSHPKIIGWAEQMESTEQDWKFDLEDRDQLKTVLFKVMDLPIKSLTKAGIEKLGEDMSKHSKEELFKYAAADKFSLSSLAVDHAEIRPLLEYRKMHKAYTTYVRSMRNHFNDQVDKNKRSKAPYLMDDSCVHASFLQTGTRAGRLSCKSPNLQQLPRDSIVKRMYVSRFGDQGAIYQGDLSQIELRLIASCCGDPTMVKAYHDGVDLHSLTTSKIFKIDYDKFSKDHMAWLQKNGREKEAKQLSLKRSIGKTANFLTGYGGGPLGLQSSLQQDEVYLPMDECEDIIHTFFDVYPSLRKHISLFKDFILDHGVAVSVLGRVRVFEEVFSDDRESKAKALRSGYNHLIQSTASDMMLCCITVIELLMRDAGLESMLVSTVHDSLVIDAKRSELPVIHEICHSIINNIPEVLKLRFGENYDTSWILVPLSGDFEVGRNYLDQKTVPKTNIDWDALLSGEN